MSSGLSGLSGLSGVFGGGFVSSGLVAEYRFDEGSGQVLTDYVGGYHGQLGSGTGADAGDPTWTARGLNFSGGGQYVDLTTLPNLSSWTIQIVMNAKNPIALTASVAPISRDKNFQINWSHPSASFKGAVSFANGSSTYYSASFGTLVNNTWYCLTGSYASQLLKAYKNRSFANQTATTGTPANEATSAKMGRLTGLAQDWPGQIAYCLIYNRQLSDAEVAANYDALQARLASRGVVLLANGQTDPNLAAATNAAAALTTPTYDGSGEATHPDVYYNASKWPNASGAQYWMALTPYPTSQEAFENPSILQSSDGTTWTVPSGLTNPLDPDPPGAEYNSDNDLFVDTDNAMYCIWRYSDKSTLDILYALKSVDGVTWTNKTELFRGGRDTLASPAFAYAGGVYYCWYVDTIPSPNVLYRRTASSILGPWSAAQACTVTNVASTRDVWHLDVVRQGSEWHAFVDMCARDGSGGSAALHFATSVDGLRWVLSGVPMLDVTSAGHWDDERIYRASGVRTGGSGYDLWYSARNQTGEGGNWHIGKTTVTGV